MKLVAMTRNQRVRVSLAMFYCLQALHLMLKAHAGYAGRMEARIRDDWAALDSFPTATEDGVCIGLRSTISRIELLLRGMRTTLKDADSFRKSATEARASAGRAVEDAIEVIKGLTEITIEV